MTKVFLISWLWFLSLTCTAYAQDGNIHFSNSANRLQHNRKCEDLSNVEAYIVNLYRRNPNSLLGDIQGRFIHGSPQGIQRDFSKGLLSAKEELFDQKILSGEERLLAENAKEILQRNAIEPILYGEFKKPYKRSEGSNYASYDECDFRRPGFMKSNISSGYRFIVGKQRRDVLSHTPPILTYRLRSSQVKRSSRGSDITQQRRIAPTRFSGFVKPVHSVSGVTPSGYSIMLAGGSCSSVCSSPAPCCAPKCTPPCCTVRPCCVPRCTKPPPCCVPKCTTPCCIPRCTTPCCIPSCTTPCCVPRCTTPCCIPRCTTACCIPRCTTPCCIPRCTTPCCIPRCTTPCCTPRCPTPCCIPRCTTPPPCCIPKCTTTVCIPPPRCIPRCSQPPPCCDPKCPSACCSSKKPCCPGCQAELNYGEEVGNGQCPHIAVQQPYGIQMEKQYECNNYKGQAKRYYQISDRPHQLRYKRRIRKKRYKRHQVT